MPKAKPKIWKEWIRITTVWEDAHTLRISRFNTLVFQKEYNGLWYITQLGLIDKLIFKTKEQAMLKAQSLILKEFREIQKVMRDKV